MKKKILTAIIAGVSLSSLMVLPLINRTGRTVFAEQVQTCYVDFFNNYSREEFTLSNGFTGRGNNLIYKTVGVAKDGLLSKPEDPVRARYQFAGWFKEEECVNPWNFSTDTVSRNTRLFAYWEPTSAGEIVEPTYTPPSTVLEESAEVDYVIDSVMNFKKLEKEVASDPDFKVSRSAINKLVLSKDNVLPLMEYKVKNSLSITATYNVGSGKITVTKSNDTDNPDTYLVADNSAAYTLTASDSSNYSSYETKAKNYEAKYETEESYHVMLAGSSSIEFWETSKEDLDPIVSYNHGIGGTTIENWTNKLNQRLVYPYKPKLVVYYVGINNVINSKQSSTTINELIDKFFDETHKSMPNTKVIYILMNQLPGYSTYKNTIDAVNNHVRDYQATHSSWLVLTNPGKDLLKPNGNPSAAYFRTDGLHLSYYGYTIWGGIIKQAIIDELNKMA